VSIEVSEMTMSPFRLIVTALTLVLAGCITPPELDPREPACGWRCSRSG
jgi:hypothetical protein